MNSIEDFYRRLNKSTEPIDDQPYIEKTSFFMNECLKNNSRLESLLVLGAGNMNDMSLDFFLRKFQKVTLSDIDTLSIEENTSIKNSTQAINIKQIDYLGLEDNNFFNELRRDLISANSKEEIKHLIKARINKLFDYDFSNEINMTSDVVYISPIYTQLLYRQAEVLIQSLTSEELRKSWKSIALQSLLQEMILVINHFNLEVTKIVKNKGIIFVASDIFTLKDDAFSKRIRECIDSYDEMEDLYVEYLERYGYGLGDYGLYAMKDLVKPIDSKWFLWHQSKHQTYVVKFYAFEKIDDN